MSTGTGTPSTAEMVARLRAADATLASLAAKATAVSAERDLMALGLHDAGWQVPEIAGLLGASSAKGRASGVPVTQTRVRAMLARARKQAGRPPAKAGRPPGGNKPSIVAGIVRRP